VQVALHPSLGVVFPSSQVSEFEDSSLLLPQSLSHVDKALGTVVHPHPDSIAQLELHPSRLFGLPSSQASPIAVLSMPSPQVLLQVDLRAKFALGNEHVYPAS